MLTSLKWLSLKITAHVFFLIGPTPFDISNISYTPVFNKPSVSLKFARWILCSIIAIPLSYFLPSFTVLIAVLMGYREATEFQIVWACAAVFPSLTVMSGEVVFTLFGKEFAEAFENFRHLEAQLEAGNKLVLN